MGAYDYVLKPFNIPEMLDLIKQAIEAGYFMRAPVAVDAVPDETSWRCHHRPEPGHAGGL